MSTSLEVATLGGGCFWCIEAPFLEMKGVKAVESGYSGGHVPNPTYEQICTKTTGHVEVVQIQFDPAVVQFREILEVFFALHDPTSMDRQGNDAGPQYRSVIFTHHDEQLQIATQLIHDLNEAKAYSKPIVTVVEPLRNYYSAEAYHQNYFWNNSNQPYCAYVVAPKILKFREKFPQYQATE